MKIRSYSIGLAIPVTLAMLGAAPPEETKALGVDSQEPYGEYLVDAEGRTVYLFEPDREAQGSTCYDRCAEAWPPLITEGEPEVTSDALDPDKVGTLTREDGTQQVTYGGWPLYYFVQDTQPGDVEGQDVHGFGGGWYLISPEGEKIETTAPAELGS